MGDIGNPVREIEFEPLEEPALPITPAVPSAPSSPAPVTPTKEPEKVPA